MSPVLDYRNLPRQYVLTVEVKLTELPNQALGKLTAIPMNSAAFYSGQQAGFDFRKAATVTVSNFAALAYIIEKYDELTWQIEAERP